MTTGRRLAVRLFKLTLSLACAESNAILSGLCFRRLARPFSADTPQVHDLDHDYILTRAAGANRAPLDYRLA